MRLASSKLRARMWTSARQRVAAALLRTSSACSANWTARCAAFQAAAGLSALMRVQQVGQTYRSYAPAPPQRGLDVKRAPPVLIVGGQPLVAGIAVGSQLVELGDCLGIRGDSGRRGRGRT